MEEEALNLHASVKRRALESYDNSDCIVTEASGKLSDTAKTLQKSLTYMWMKIS